MSQRIKGIVRYDGTDYAGWQVQPGVPTIQGVMEEKLALIAGQPVRIMSAGRTDAGVHALGQVVSFDWTSDVPLDRLRRSLCQMLSPSIRIENLERAADDFHATYSAKSKRYAYVLCQARDPDPFAARYTWCVPREIDRRQVHELAQRVVGTHDFAGFCASGSLVETTVRTISSVKVLDGPVVGPNDYHDLWRIEFDGNGFLYKMVRNLTGTLIDIARGQLPESTIDERLHAPMPYLGYTAPAQGLFLLDVKY
jgi:tRNA pseudouridine38-40 synthase